MNLSDNDKNLISILIPVLRPNLTLLEMMLASIRKNEMQAKILIGLQSKEDISAICKKYNAEVIYFEKPSLYLTRIGLLARCTSEYVWFADGDDLFIPHAIDYVCNLLLTYKPDICLVRFRKFTSNNIPEINDFSNTLEWIDKDRLLLNFYSGRIPNAIFTKIFKRESFPVKIFPKIDVFMGEDALITNILFTNCRSQNLKLDSPLYLYRISSSQGSSVFKFNHLYDLLKVANEINKNSVYGAWRYLKSFGDIIYHNLGEGKIKKSEINQLFSSVDFRKAKDNIFRQIDKKKINKGKDKFIYFYLSCLFDYKVATCESLSFIGKFLRKYRHAPTKNKL